MHNPSTPVRQTRGSPYLLCLGLLLTTLGGCAVQNNHPDTHIAEQFIDAFYSFDPVQLEQTLDTPANETAAALYYQAWAQAAHYQLQTRRPCRAEVGRATQTTFSCAITVTDDFGSTLGYTATDTFVIAVRGDKVSSVTFSGDDPPIFGEVFAWIQSNRPEVMSGPCQNMFAGGRTPADCARAVADAARAFVQQSPSQK